MAQVTCMKRGKTWQYRFEGAPVNGKRQRFTKGGFATKKEAQEAGVKALAEYENSGLNFIPSELSVSDYLDYWMKEYCEINLKPSTCAGYRKRIKNHIDPELGKYRLRSLAPAIIQQFINQKFNEGYSRNSLISLKAILTCSLSYAVQPLRFIQQSPMLGIKIPSTRAIPKTPSRKKVREIVTEEEWNVIIERFPFGHSCHLPLLLAYRCGLRLGEAFALDWTKDIDLNAGSLDVNKQVQEINGHWTFINPKYDSFRTIALDKPMIEVLKKAITQIERAEKYYAEYFTRLYENPQRQIVAENGPGCKEIHMLTVRPNGTYIQPRTMQHCARVVHYDLGYKNFDFHSLRHTHTTMLLEKGANAKDVQERLGHKNIWVTLQTYAHDTTEMQRQTIQILNELPLSGSRD